MLKNGEKFEPIKQTLTSKEMLRYMDILDELDNLNTEYNKTHDNVNRLQEKMDHLIDVTHPYVHVDIDSIPKAKYDVLEPLWMMEDAIINQYKTFNSEIVKIVSKMKKLTREKNMLIRKARQK